MIEKLRTLDDIPTNTQFEKNILIICSTYTNKINELVDAVNELQQQVKEIMTWRFETDDEPAENEKCAKNAQDLYAEQREWIGKLCKFEGENYGILKEIGCSDTKQVWRDGAFRSSDGYWYDHCEPVKPYDNIIYKDK